MNILIHILYLKFEMKIFNFEIWKKWSYHQSEIKHLKYFVYATKEILNKKSFFKFEIKISFFEIWKN
jgi:hypothetical protein